MFWRMQGYTRTVAKPLRVIESNGAGAAAPPGIELDQGDGVPPESPNWVSVMA